ncbi:MAG: putative Na+/H+ antiporter, partial [Planctomycetaceae bacterium]
DMQRYWLQPLISDRPPAVLFFGATALTAITDNAALTYLGTLVEGLTANLKYALVAGAVCGGGLTVIANAPNPAGVGILQSARAFQPSGISPIGLLLGSLWPTAVAMFFFWFVGSAPTAAPTPPPAPPPEVRVETTRCGLPRAASPHARGLAWTKAC